jgi:transcriptional regulator with PAS, ATPase and Fis domain
VILENADQITPGALPYDMQHNSDGAINSFELSAMEKKHIQTVLNYAKGNKTEAALLLNIGLTTLYRKIEEYGISK